MTALHPFTGRPISSHVAALDAEMKRRRPARRQPKPTTVDFESFKIEPRPDYPPFPIGVSIKYWKKPARYYAFGHTTGNNCGFEDARRALEQAWKTPDGLLFQHGKFDLAVAEVHFGLKPPGWERMHDSMFMLFLDDPNQRELGLKPASTRVLGWPADERDEVADWLVRHQPVHGIRISASTSHQAKHPFGAYLAYAPGDVVGRYAGSGVGRGDTDRTEALFERLWPSLVERGMLVAYERERRLVPVLMETEADGIRVDLPRLRADVTVYRKAMADAEAWLSKKLGRDDINFNSGDQVMAAVIEAGLVEPGILPLTEKDKKYQATEEAFRLIEDVTVGAMLTYRIKLKTVLTTFLENWLRVAERSGGLIFTQWNQTRGERGGGARTGRLSSTPNFQNLSKEFKPIWRHEQPERRRKRAKVPVDRRKRLLPVCPVKGFPTLPLARDYVIPYEPGHVLIDRDYSQQEPRILAHFEDGELTRQYNANPWIDYHDNAKDNLERITGKRYDRRPVKDINLGLIYGEGIGALAQKTGLTVEETGAIKKAILAMYPGLKKMNDDMKSLAAQGLPLRTWGGRLCMCEPPSIVRGRFKTWEYKMVNTLIQGSAGDCTKEAMIRYHATKRKGERFYLTAHDQFLSSVPGTVRDDAMERMRVAIESVEFDVPMLSEGKWSPKSWHDLKDYDKKGKRLVAANTNGKKVAA